MASGGPRESLAALVRDIGETGRGITDEELRRLRTGLSAAVVAAPNLARVDDDLGGLLWRGRILTGDEWLPRLEAKFLKHVVLREEWPDRTTLDAYTISLTNAVQDANAGVYLDRDLEAWRMTFVARSRSSRGPAGGPYMLVVFLAEKGFWVTGYQPEEEGRSIRPDRLMQGGRWLRLVR